VTPEDTNRLLGTLEDLFYGPAGGAALKDDYEQIKALITRCGMSSTGALLPAVKMQKALTVVMLHDDGAVEADQALAKLDAGGAFVVTKSEMFFHQLRLRVAIDPTLLEKIDVFYLTDGGYQPVGLLYDDELRWPVGFLLDAWRTEGEIQAVRGDKKMLGKESAQIADDLRKKYLSPPPSAPGKA
jgi:hypothetical protein